MRSLDLYMPLPSTTVSGVRGGGYTTTIANGAVS